MQKMRHALRKTGGQMSLQRLGLLPLLQLR